MFPITLAFSGGSLNHFPWVAATVLGILAIALSLGLLWKARQLHVTAKRELEMSQDTIGASEQRWRLLFEQSPLSIQIFSPDGQTQKFNRAWSELFRLSDEMGYAFNVLEAPDLVASGAVNLIRKAFEGDPVRVPPVPYPVNTDPPETRWIGGVLYPVKDKNGDVMEVVVIHHDVTEVKRAEEAMLAINQTLEGKVTERTRELESARLELAQALEQERELGELKSRFVSMVSHEFRTPLGVTMSAVELLTHYRDKLSEEKTTELYQDIRSATQTMVEMMEQVLLLGRTEAGRLTHNAFPLELETLMRTIGAEVESVADRPGAVAWVCDDSLDGARADELLLRHIFSNLISNAVKYSPPDAEVRCRLWREGAEAVFEIEDSGIGIPEKDRAHLFEAFHRCGNVGEAPGTGLGLVIVKRCVDLHGGQLTFESEEGKGTTFTVRLPLYS